MNHLTLSLAVCQGDARYGENLPIGRAAAGATAGRELCRRAAGSNAEAFG
jgi:hypothetical protein